jgi:acyl carrier protein
MLCEIMQVEIVMALEEEFGISVSESGAESISTVQDAANLIQAAISDKSR